MNNGVKQRFDGGGSEFGRIHRLLPTFCTMGDIDSIKVNVDTHICFGFERANEKFIEYRTNLETGNVTFVAIIENKYKESPKVMEAIENLSTVYGTAMYMLLALARQINCRYLIMIGTCGNPPFKILEVDTLTGDVEHVAILDYTKENEQEKIMECWKKLGLLISF